MGKELLLSIIANINKYKEDMTFMEVCGTHTNAIGKFGIRNILNSNIKLISGPGCPVCVTPSYYIDYAYKLCVDEKIIIVTYGDMLRVPGSSPYMTLDRARSLGGKVEIVYSAIDAVELASKNKKSKFLFLGIGFETTTPATGILIKEIVRRKLNNLFILSMHKKVEPVITQLLQSKEVNIDGFILPGNVGVIIGEDGFDFIKKEEGIGVISGFKDEEILTTLKELCEMKAEGIKGEIKNNYKTFVSKEGNLIGKKLIDEIFREEVTTWRGLGEIEGSGLALREEFRDIDILTSYSLEDILEEDFTTEKGGCRCGDVLKGKITPKECMNFGKVCNPGFPIGPCMVSSEGTCASYYKYL